MCDFKGTPSPWGREIKCTKYGKKIRVIIPEATHQRVLALGTVYDDESDKTREVEHANAALIAKSPDMFNFIKKCIEESRFKNSEIEMEAHKLLKSAMPT